MKNNKGFSLVELIIVIAILAILVGVMAPLLYIYVSRTKVSADIQLCDSIQEAIVYAMSDPDVVNADDSSKSQIDEICSGNKVALGSIGDSEFSRCVNDTMGYDVFSVSGNREHFTTQIAKENGEVYAQFYDGKYYVWINGSDSSGKDNNVVTADNASLVGNGVIYSF